MNKTLSASIYFACALAILFPLSAGAITTAVDSLSGRIMLQVEENGEAWYLDPQSQKRVFLGKPEEAFGLINKFSVAVSDHVLNLIENNSAPKMLSGLFVQNPGALWYIHPGDRTAANLSGPTDVYNLMKNYSQGISNADLARIPVLEAVALGQPNLDLSRLEDLSQWWGRVNAAYSPVYAGTTTQTGRIGWLWPVNRVKVMAEVLGENIDGNELWYKIDGGAYPGAYVHSSYIDPAAQPLPPSQANIPEAVKEGEYWIDLDIGRQVLSLYRYDRPVFSTFAATGQGYFPTRTGTFRIQTKLLRTRMSGGPPRFPAPYDLPNVPFTMYYSGDFAIHGAYWHDKFGSPQSHGCTNLTQGDAAYLFSRAAPALMSGVSLAYATQNLPGTIVYNHY